MTNFENIEQQFNQKAEEAKAHIEQHASEALADLYKQGVIKIKVHYSASSDEGILDPERVSFYDKDSLWISPNADLEPILDLCYENLLPSGWEINNGSEGYIEFDMTNEGQVEVDISHYWINPVFDEDVSGISIDLSTGAIN